MAEATSSGDIKTRKSIAADSFTLHSFLDEVESRVEALRRQASTMITEQASLLLIIEQLKNDCLKCHISSEDYQELIANMERLKARCEAVQMQVHTVRDEAQLHSLQRVNGALEELITRLSSETQDPAVAVEQARAYRNACLPEAFGIIDTRFQSMVLGCAVDDQKDVRRRLESLVREYEIVLGNNPQRISKSKEFLERVTQCNNSANNEGLSDKGKDVNSPSALDQQVDDTNSTDSTVENYLRTEWHSSPADAFDSGRQSITQQLTDDVQQLHATDGESHKVQS